MKITFQSPLGEVVKETSPDMTVGHKVFIMVSIPSRGSGKGDFFLQEHLKQALSVSIPSRGSGKGDIDEMRNGQEFGYACFNPLSGKW